MATGRTSAQKALYVVSLVMLVLGILVVLAGIATATLGGLLYFAGADYPMQLAGQDVSTSGATSALGFIVVVLGAVDMVLAILGLRAAKDARKIGPYRIMCYVIVFVIIAIVVYGATQGKHFLWNPVVLAANIVYAFICTNLAEAVKKDAEAGLTSVPQAHAERSGSQKALRVLSIVLIVLGAAGALMGIAVLALGIASFSTGVDSMMEIGDAQLPASVGLVTLGVASLIGSALDLLVGIFGLRGAKNPEKMKPFFVLCVICGVIALIGLVTSAIRGTLGSDGLGSAVDLLFIGACAYLAYDIRLQSKSMSS